MTQEQYIRTSKFENVLRSAVNSRYLRCMDSRIQAEFVSICKDLNIFVKPTCPACMLNAATALGRQYFDYQSQMKQDNGSNNLSTQADNSYILTSPEAPEQSVSSEDSVDSGDVKSKNNTKSTKKPSKKSSKKK